MILTKRKRSSRIELPLPSAPTVDRPVILPQPRIDSPLVGAELLEHFESCTELTREAKAISCGYFSLNGKGIRIPKVTKFMEALVFAHAITFSPVKKTGRFPTYMVKVSPGGQICIGLTYIKKYGYDRGDTFKISASRTGFTLDFVSHKLKETVQVSG